MTKIVFDTAHVGASGVPTAAHAISPPAINTSTGSFGVVVESWTSQADRDSGCQPADALALLWEVDAYDMAMVFTLAATVQAHPEWLGAPAPSATAVWNMTRSAWVEKLLLSDMKLAKNAQINASRMAANQGTFTYAGKEIAADPLARGDIDAINGIVSLIQALPAGWPGFWKCADNSYLPISDVPTWIAFYGALVEQGQVNFARSQVLKAQLAAATTLAEIEAVSWA